MPRKPIESWFYAVVAVRSGDRFLLIQEPSHGQPWYFPAGRVEPGESLIRAAERETLEEAGIPIAVTHVIRIEHTPHAYGTRVRAIFLAHPLDDTPPKSVPDEESLGAVWVRLDELNRYPLRSQEVRHVFEYLERGGPVYPIGLIRAEGEPYALPS